MLLRKIPLGQQGKGRNKDNKHWGFDPVQFPLILVGFRKSQSAKVWATSV